MPKVTIAAVNGAAAGAGLSWACATDLRYTSESAKFITAFSNAGLMPRAHEIAQQLAAAAPITQGLIKQNLNDADHISFAELLDREAQRHVFSGGTEDAAEAGHAFMEKRPPSFKGR